tara:strand:+ start:373 stop:1221 length:849 start_codon:yes stop_codon:yes gene_type:complete
MSSNKPKKGQWVCSQCGTKNHQWQDSCWKCDRKTLLTIVPGDAPAHHELSAEQKLVEYEKWISISGFMFMFSILIGLILFCAWVVTESGSNIEEKLWSTCCWWWLIAVFGSLLFGIIIEEALGESVEYIPDSSNRDVCQRWFCDNAPYGDCPTCGVKFCSNHAKHSFDSPWPVAKFGNQLPNKIWPCRFCYDRQKKERFPNSSRAQFDEYLLNTLGKRNITKHRSVSTKVQSRSNLTPSTNVPESKAPSVIGKTARVILLPIVIIGGLFWLGSSDHKKGGPP